jgi:glucokinase
MNLLVLDVGGSHIAGALCDPDALRLSTHSSVSVDSNGDDESFYHAVDELTRNLLKGHETQINGMSFAFPGPFDYREGISHLTHKFAALNGKNLRTILAARFHLEPQRIHFVNDADAFLLGEMTQVPAARVGNTAGITLGTGVGSAFAVNGQIVRRGHGVPSEGEIWNLPWESGIVEDAISTRGLRQAYEERTGRRTSVREMAESCPADPAAVAVFESFGHTLGNVLRSVTGAFRPSTVIFGGAISRSAPLFLPFTAHQFGGTKTFQVSTLFEEAALYGAASRWNQQAKSAGNSR